jgi:LmbE family N-acetylglucosaminyl deacetylase
MMPVCLSKAEGAHVEIELGDAVAAVRQELLEAAARGLGHDVGFVVGPVEMEFVVELKADVKAKAGFKAWVVTADAETAISRGRTHKVRVTLTPKRADGGDLLVSDQGGSLTSRGDLSARQGR